MFKSIKNKNGASLIEIVATITIASIALLMIYNILAFNIHQNGVNQERTLNANIANGTLNYIKNQDFSTMQTYLENNANYYAIINDQSCNTLLSNDIDTCTAVLSPVINNKHYNSSNLYVYLLPFNDKTKLDALKMTPPPQAPDVLINYLENLDTTEFTDANINQHAIRVIVIVESSISTKYDYLLEGVITDE